MLLIILLDVFINKYYIYKDMDEIDFILKYKIINWLRLIFTIFYTKDPYIPTCIFNIIN
jgi:hypothetical protein